MDSVQLAVGRGGQWAMVNIWPWWMLGFSGQLTLDSGQHRSDSGHWAQWAVGNGKWAVSSVYIEK